jgi:glyoxylase-like metal-dependent hydrolase (beta-lactamase superfamily II)
MTTWAIGEVQITRVDDPGFELVLPQDEAAARPLLEAGWLVPDFVDPAGALRIGSSATVIRAPGAILLVDPFLAFDDPARLGPRLMALREAGVEAADVDIVVNTHVDGLGVNLLADGSPTFPRARYLVPRAELEAIRAGTHGQADQARPLVELWADGPVEATEGVEALASGVRLEDAPGHNPGHHVVWVEVGDVSAVVVGHLFLHPAQIARPEVDNGDLDPVLLDTTRRALLARCADQGTLVVGPLFAPPGAGVVAADGDTWRLDPA